MSECKVIRRKRRRICIGDMDTKVSLQTRSLQPPEAGSFDFDETFTTVDDVWALVETVRGETVFDGSNTEQDITHHFYVRYIPNITFENWVQVDGIRYDIIDVENLDNRNEFYLIRCNLRGSNTVEVNKS